MIDRIHLPYRDRSDAFDLAAIADDLEETVADPTERAVARSVAADLLAGNTPSTMGEALDLLEQASPEARRALLDRARQSEGLPTLIQERAAESARHPMVTSGPTRDGRGFVDAVCSEPGCMNHEIGEFSQFRRVNVKRWYCGQHREGHEEEMKPYEGRRYGFAASGAIVDLEEQELERIREEAEAESRRRVREERMAEARHDTEALREHRAAAEERERRENALQAPWRAA